MSTRIPKREAIDNSGTMCPTRGVGRPGIIMSHMWVDITRRPSANAILSGHVVFHLLWTGVPSMTKIWVVPESAIASFDACCLGANEENANSRLIVEPFETFDVMTVMSSSSTMNSLMGENKRGGSDVVLITENVS